jgi:16S rRNA (guanine527-N7)-methyltransferase
MPTPNPLTPERIAELLQPYVEGAQAASELAPPPTPQRADWPRIYHQLTSYLELILKWDTRINLTAIRDPEEIVRRHFGESLFAGLALNQHNGDLAPCDSLLDFGSGAGFPGLPIQLLLPELPVTLAESRTRKAAFLREVVRTLGLRTEVWADRVEAMPPTRRFDAVALRAVDEMESAVAEAVRRARHRLLILGVRDAVYPALAEDFVISDRIPLPGSLNGEVIIAHRRSG